MCSRYDFAEHSVVHKCIACASNNLVLQGPHFGMCVH
jgi:hypothetical protein